MTDEERLADIRARWPQSFDCLADYMFLISLAERALRAEDLLRLQNARDGRACAGPAINGEQTSEGADKS